MTLANASANDLGAPPGQLRVLHVEDNELDAELVAEALRKGGFSASVVVVQTEAEFGRQLRSHSPDVVIADYNLPQWTGMEALAVLRREGLDIPLILVSGALGDVTAVECIKRGATDYVLKDGLARLPEAMRRALQEKHLLHLRRQAEEALKESLAASEAVRKDLADQKFALDQHVIVAVTDVKGRITYANDKFCAISKYSREELLGQDHRILNSGHHPKEFFQQMYRTITNGKVWHGEIKNRAKDGSFYWVDATIVPFLDTNGKPRQYAAIRTDITERKRAEEVRERLAAVVESSDDAIIAKTLDGVIIAWNRGAEKVFGYSSPEAVGKSMRMLIPPERANEEPDILARIGRGESVEHFETVRVRKDGKSIDVSVTISPIRDSGGAIVGASKIARNITERKHSEQRLADKAEELARSNRDLEQFAYVASHDLQEPLRMVASYTQLLSERYGGKLDENADKFLGYAREGALRMQVLIQDLLVFSRVVRAGVTCKNVDCNVALEEAVQSLTAAIEESGGVVTHAALPNVWADQTQIAQVFQNLIGNAVKFRKEAPPAISVQAEKSGRNWLFSVSDNGIGIAPEYAENIFVVFQRLHARTEYPGNGIGLAICKKIIEHYGGTIGVESRVGQGSTFKFTLPAAAPEEEGRARL
jgi:PAS domain S-box-containing protein